MAQRGHVWSRRLRAFPSEFSRLRTHCEGYGTSSCTSSQGGIFDERCRYFSWQIVRKVEFSIESLIHLPARENFPSNSSVLRPAPSAHRCKHGESLVRQALPITWENSAKKEKKKSSGRRGKNDGPHCTRTSHPVTPHFPTHRV